MNEKKYDENGYLIISEMDTCPFWEKDTIPCRSGWTQACFFCRFTDFRTDENIRRAQEASQGKILYSICRNEKNRKNEAGEGV